ncbi:family 16 glycoside hydrolase [Chloroflexota bacterium]
MQVKTIWSSLSWLIMVAVLLASCAPKTIPETSKTVLYSDDFSDVSSGWNTFEDEEGWVHYEKGWLHVLNVTSSEGYTFSSANQHFTDFILEVETKLVGGTDDNFQIVLARFKDSGNSYRFAISADGYYYIVVKTEGSKHILVESTRSSHIHQGLDAVNLVRVECVGDTLRMSVNGHLLQEVTDNRLRSGDIGLAAASYADTLTEVAFDNIMITVP